MVRLDAIVLPHMTLCLTPEVLDPVDMVPFIGKSFCMVDPPVMEVGYIQSVVSPEGVRVDDTVRLHLLLNDGKSSLCTGYWE